MNLLAHIFLSGTDDKIKIGNAIGDFVKGKDVQNFESEIKTGILLHREIDRFTDQHEIVLKSKERLRPKYRHYAPVIVDIFYDHYLAKDWSTFHAEKLLDFTAQFYDLTRQYHDQIPVNARHMMQYMRRDDWLTNYQHIEGIDRALTGMSRRTRFESKMEQSAEDLVAGYELYRSEFHEYFPILIQHCEDFLSSHS
ncbi:MAG: acyl carrier protein phosphodiesterase [Cyclobacteriaceae bacterium]|nr:acyl carrier protein phosphodiesterase [Cyclobacteriaceae bacterium HetDA_MAG_MS6]